MKLCECGCGQPAPISPYSSKTLGYVKGEPRRFVRNHSQRVVGFQVKHGFLRRGREVREYLAYKAAKERCTRPSHWAWKWYGGRGIKFLFESFEQFFAEIGPRPEGKVLNRINSDGHYEPGNVRWATWKESGANKRQGGGRPRRKMDDHEHLQKTRHSA